MGAAHQGLAAVKASHIHFDMLKKQAEQDEADRTQVLELRISAMEALGIRDAEITKGNLVSITKQCGFYKITIKQPRAPLINL